MTEDEWQSCEDPLGMLWSLQKDRVWDRKMRLLAVGYCRGLWHLLTDERCQEAVNVAELFADGNVTIDELDAVFEVALDLSHSAEPDSLQAFAARIAYSASMPCAMRSGTIYCIGWEAAFGVARNAKHASRFDLSFPPTMIRDVIGPLPFRSFMLDSLLLKSHAVSMAHEIYDDHTFDRLPMLADALEDAGFYNLEILDHCRQPARHIRGCWVVDLLTDRHPPRMK